MEGAVTVPHETVSCTVVALSSLGTPGSPPHLESHTFLNLLVTTSSLSFNHQTGAHTVDTVALLYSLVYTGCILDQDKIPPSLFTILTSPELYQHIRLSTTRIPIFDHRIGNPSFGHLGLGSLAKFLSVSSPPVLAINAIDNQHDWNLAEVKASKIHWRSLGAELPYHFILIVAQEYTPPSSEPTTPVANLSPSHLLPSRSLSPPTNPVLQLQSSWDPSMFDTFMNTACPSEMLYTLSPPSSPNTATNPPEPPAGIHLPAPIDDVAPAIYDYRSRLVPGMTLAEILATAGITGEQTQSAHFLSTSDSRSLWVMYRNHHAAASILETLGFIGNCNRILYKGGLDLTVSEVLKQLGWRLTTYQRKSKAFAEARRYADSYIWTDTVPPARARTNEQKAIRKAYDSWNGLVAFFRDGGFCDAPSPPCDGPDALESERHASKISQNYVYGLAKNLPKIQHHLGRRTQPHPS
ncbi:hypothetical protein C8R43DRAFT_1128285 [Mycena crocata]|nr:hypothetical protein C8R43DRAFT_1128285 [Mycena crocata]